MRSALASALVVTLALSTNSAGALAPDAEAVAPQVRLSSQPCIERLAVGLDCPLWLDAQPTGDAECPYRVLDHRICPRSPAGWGDRVKLEAFAIGCALRGPHMDPYEQARCEWVPAARLIFSGDAPVCRHELLMDPFDPAFDVPFCLNFAP